MAVAKSYENMKILCEPYHYDNDPKKLYVKVQGPCKRCGGSGHYSYNQIDGTMCLACRGSGKEVKEVRWYTETQRAALDRAAEKRAADKAVKVEERRVKFAARNAFGFGEAGYITIFKGDSDVINEWAHETSPCRARFNNLFGWFVPSNMAIENLPVNVETIIINWEDVRDKNDPENLTMRDNAEVRKYVLSLTTTNTSTYQGEIGEWIERVVTVKRNIALDTRYGSSKMHIMEDADGNVYVWTTSSKSFECGKTLNLRMKIKDHKEYDDVQQTIVYYCTEK